MSPDPDALGITASVVGVARSPLLAFETHRGPVGFSLAESLRFCRAAMSASALVEPLVVVVLLFGGTWVNRNRTYRLSSKTKPRWTEKDLEEDLSDSPDSPFAADNRDPFLSSGQPSELLGVQEPKWRRRQIGLGRVKLELISPNTRRFRNYFLSRLLLKFPFLVEAWYWALIYWVYQLGRAFTAVNLVEGTVDVARGHALQIVHLEQRLNIFWEPAIQRAFLKHDVLMHWINRLYSFIHIPGTIFFLVWLYHYTTARNRVDDRTKDVGDSNGMAASPKLYEARRRTMALCNLLAFVVFTAWPCMPPRLLSDKNVEGPEGDEARSFGFVDTVHGASGESSVWTQNRFCNQYAAMPSLHFGYALMIGLTVALIPLEPKQRRLFAADRSRFPSVSRLVCITLGFLYPFIILVAIITTANHFILDAVAGACVCAAGWCGNAALLNLLPVEDYFLWCVRIHKPQRYIVEVDGFTDERSHRDRRGVHGVIEQ